MTKATKTKAARPARVEAASKADNTENSNTLFVVEKDGFTEIRVQLTDFFGATYIDARYWKIHDFGKRVPTVKGLTIPVAMLPELIDALSKAQAAAAAASRP